MAFAHHQAAFRDQRGGPKAELIGAQQRPYDHVPAGAQAAVHLYGDTTPQRVQDQGLMGFGQADFPR